MSFPILALLSLFILYKLSYFPEKWVCDAFSKWRQEMLMVVRKVKTLSYICAVLRRNNFIKPDITMIVTLWFLAGTQ